MSRLLKYLLLAAAVYLAVNKNFRTLAKNHLLLLDLKKQLAACASEQERLTREKARLSDDKSDYVERLARRENFLKPGEVEFRFTPPAAKK